EGVISAVALRCHRGELKGKLVPSHGDEIARCKIMALHDMVKVVKVAVIDSRENAIFKAKELKNGEVLKGVQFKGQAASTESVVMRTKSGTVRFIDGQHSLKKKPNLIIES